MKTVAFEEHIEAALGEEQTTWTLPARLCLVAPRLSGGRVSSHLFQGKLGSVCTRGLGIIINGDSSNSQLSQAGQRTVGSLNQTRKPFLTRPVSCPAAGAPSSCSLRPRVTSPRLSSASLLLSLGEYLAYTFHHRALDTRSQIILAAALCARWRPHSAGQEVG